MSDDNESNDSSTDNKSIDTPDEIADKIGVSDKGKGKKSKQKEPKNRLIKEAYDWSVNLNKKARRGQYSDLLPRPDVFDPILNTLNRHRKSNVLIVGQAGIGKSALVKSLVHEIENNNFDTGNINPTFIGINLSMVEMKGYKRMIRWASRDEIVLVIDEIHQLLKDDDLFELYIEDLKPRMVDGDINIVGMTTRREYHKHLEENQAIDRRFNQINLNEPNKEQTIQILKQFVQAHDDITCAKNVLSNTYTLAQKALPNQKFPDKALDVLDVASAKVARSDNDIVQVDDVKEIAYKLSNAPVNHPGELMDNVEKLKVPVSSEKQLLVKSEIKQSLQNNTTTPLATLGYYGSDLNGFTQNLARQLFTTNEATITVDVSRFMDDGWQFLGAAPGYKDSGKKPKHFRKLAHNPFSVFVFKNVHGGSSPNQALISEFVNNGTITDNRGRKHYLSQSVVVIDCTSEPNSKNKDRQKVNINELFDDIITVSLPS